ncbi:MAG: tRNA (guanosine(37)-N1)-methyltransferase TrmD [Desulfotomaculales bacterium]
MEINILTLFPEMFAGPFDASIVGRARERGLVKINLVNIRDFAKNKHRTVDDAPFGGGAGMVMSPEPVFEAVDWLRGRGAPLDAVVLLSPGGRPFNQETAWELSRLKGLALICGHYEGIDARVAENLATDEISIGDYVLTGGELPAMVVVDAVVRLIPGVLGKDASAREESFSGSLLLEYPQYTRPREYRGLAVPEILLSGHHGEIARWRRRQSLLRTLGTRPELLAVAGLTAEDRRFLKGIRDLLDGLELED